MKMSMILSLLAIFTVHALALSFKWYYSVWWLDIPMHIMGGIWVASAFFYTARMRNILPANTAAAVIFCLGVVALVGVLWEFYEFLADIYVFHKYTPLAAPGVLHFDTLKDLFDDLVGGSLALLALFIRKQLAREKV
jgi:hypothetical protein